MDKSDEWYESKYPEIFKFEILNAIIKNEIKKIFFTFFLFLR